MSDAAPGQRHDVGHLLRIRVQRREAAGGGRMLRRGGRQRPGEHQQLLVLAISARDHRPDQGRLHRERLLLLAFRVDRELERGGVDEHDRVARRIGRGNVGAAFADSLHVRHPAVRAAPRAAHLVGRAVRHRDPVRTAEEDHAAIPRNVDLRDAREPGVDGRSGRWGSAVGGRQEAGELVDVHGARVGAAHQQARCVAVVREARDRPAGVPATDLVARLRVAGHDRGSAGGRGEDDRPVAAHGGSFGRDRHRRRRRIERRAADDLVRIGDHDAGGDQVLRQHRVRPLVDVAVPAVLPVGEQLDAGSGVVDLVEVVAARDIQPPQAEDEREHDEREQRERVAPVEPAPGLAQVDVGRVAGQPRQRPSGGRRIGHGPGGRSPFSGAWRSLG